MATLILTAVGTAVAGPIGGALGALAGQAVDGQLFAPPARQGPRLSDLKVQTSTYGAPLPLLFGTMRVAGTVIWATDLQEHGSTSGGGKGRGSTTSYTYTASFAVALSARPITGVARIWADGKLLRGADGVLKVPGRYRLHLGGEDQAPDPLIASAEGVGETPAHRGLAYAVFEDLELGDFGNRIPSLTFEVTADPAAVACGTIIEAVGGPRIAAQGVGQLLDGYSAYGTSLRALAEPLATLSGAWWASANGGLTLRSGAGPAREIDDVGSAARGQGARGVRTIAAADQAPDTVTLHHYEVARDYQAGVQRATRAGPGTRTERIEVAGVLSASAAKAAATAALARADLERERRRVTLDWRHADLAPGDRVRLAGEPGLWRVADWSLEAMVLTLDLVRIARAPIAAAATPGRAVSDPDRAIGATVLHAFEIPPIDDTVLSAPRLLIAGAGGAGWRGARLQLSTDGGSTYQPLPPLRSPAVLGTISLPPGPAPSTLVDRRHAMEVTLAHEAMMLAGADHHALDRGANVALAGDELIQWGRAEWLGGARWRLSELWRGRRGTERHAGGQRGDDRFVVLTPGALVEVALPLSAIGSRVRVIASGVGDGDTPANAEVVVSGASVTPPAPVHLQLGRTSDGVAARWIRRSRAGWSWLDGVETPLGEEREAYRVSVGQARPFLASNVAGIMIPAAQVAGASTVAVQQVGQHGPSPAAVAALPI